MLPCHLLTGDLLVDWHGHQYETRQSPDAVLKLVNFNLKPEGTLSCFPLDESNRRQVSTRTAWQSLHKRFGCGTKMTLAISLSRIAVPSQWHSDVLRTCPRLWSMQY
jgi:hypothetical protein